MATDLPEGWTVQYDATNNNTPYYCNGVTGATQWETPTQPAAATAAAPTEASGQDDEKASEGPTCSVLILGGTGFVGRHLVKYLLDNNLAAHIVVADKRMPALAKLSPAFDAAFKDDRVKYVQADVSKDHHVNKAFDTEKHKVPQYHYVFNVCGETRCGCNEAEYRTRIVDVAFKCGHLAAQRGVKKWIELSDGFVYESSKEVSLTEEGKVEPKQTIATFRLQAEEALRKVEPALPLVVLRPALIYGKDFQTGLAQRIVVAAVYKYLDEKMKFLWSGNVKINCVHVTDVVAAMWVAAVQGAAGATFNLADSSNLDAGVMNKILEEIFSIETGFVNKAMNWAAKTSLTRAADHVNNKHVPAWTELCHKHEILDTRLTPYMDKEALAKHHLNLDGSKITRDTCFKYTHPNITKELIREIVDDYIQQKLFPPIL